MQELRDEYTDSDIPIVVSGNIGPRGDGYVAGKQMSAEAMAVVVGVVCGVAAGIPTAVLLLVVLGGLLAIMLRVPVKLSAN